MCPADFTMAARAVREISVSILRLFIARIKKYHRYCKVVLDVICGCFIGLWCGIIFPLDARKSAWFSAILRNHFQTRIHIWLTSVMKYHRLLSEVDIAVVTCQWLKTGVHRGDGSDRRCHCNLDAGADFSKYCRLHVALVDDWGLQRQ
jgi:hypothetical protein